MNINFLFSRIGLLAIFVGLVICVLVISSLPSVRIDLTEDDLYSLSPGTKNIVANLQGPLTGFLKFDYHGTGKEPGCDKHTEEQTYEYLFSIFSNRIAGHFCRPSDLCASY